MSNDRYENRRAGYLVNLLDQDKLTALIRERVVSVHGGTVEDAQRYIAGRGVLAKTVKGIAYICGEGVGWWADEDGTIEVEFSGGMSIGYTAIPLDDVVACISSETVELRDFVRVFGDRLDSNCYVWQSEITGIEQDWEVLVNG
jgi:hypothetical protein